jgi:hypothetical protein
MNIFEKKKNEKMNEKNEKKRKMQQPIKIKNQTKKK